MTDKKRYNLTLPVSLYEKVKEIASENDSTILNVIKMFIKIGIKLYNSDKNGSEVIIRDENGRENKITIFL